MIPCLLMALNTIFLINLLSIIQPIQIVNPIINSKPQGIDLTQRYGNYTKVLEAYDTIRYETRTRTKVKHPSATIDINREVPQDTVDTDGYCIDDSMLWGEEFVKEINSGNYDTLRSNEILT